MLSGIALTRRRDFVWESIDWHYKANTSSSFSYDHYHLSAAPNHYQNGENAFKEFHEAVEKYCKKYSSIV